MPLVFFRRVSCLRALGLALAVLSAVSLAGCGKECDSCEGDADCAAEGLVCVRFDDGSRRCGSGQGATTCRIP
jgi:hypothetical protein